MGVWATHDATGLDPHRDIATEKAALAKRGDPYKTPGGSIWQNSAIDRANKRIYCVVGRQIPGVLHAGKSSYLYMHDAKDCSLVRTTGLVEAKNDRALPTKEGVTIRPGLNGGVSATPLTIDPKLGFVYALTNEWALKYYFFESAEYPDSKL